MLAAWILGAAWIRSEPAAAAEVKRRLAQFGLTVADAPSLHRRHLGARPGHGARAYPYTVHVFYASRRAMGHAMGAVQVLEHDGRGRLGFATLPFVLMREQANLEIGVVRGSLLTGGGGAE